MIVEKEGPWVMRYKFQTPCTCKKTDITIEDPQSNSSKTLNSLGIKSDTFMHAMYKGRPHQRGGKNTRKNRKANRKTRRNRNY